MRIDRAAHLLPALALAGLCACGGAAQSSSTPASSTSAGGSDTTAGAAEPRQAGQEDASVEPGPAPESVSVAADAEGATLDNPIKACGPRASYQRVAEHRCDDGSVPLQGDLRRGQRARRGSSQSHHPAPDGDPMQSHIVDIYEVRCPSGPVTLHVCMYHCPSGASPF